MKKEDFVQEVTELRDEVRDHFAKGEEVLQSQFEEIDDLARVVGDIHGNVAEWVFDSEEEMTAEELFDLISK